MSEFKRGITNQDFITELNSNKYWQQMAKDEDLFIAIRNEHLAVYYYGQRICKVEFIRNIIKWTSHKKYLGKHEKGNANTGIYLEKIDELKQNAKKYGVKEKEHVKQNILEDKQRCIIDVEVTFEKDENNKRRSIDFLAIEKDSLDKVKLVFYEAKLFNNKEIKSRTIPKVFAQIDKYEKVLNDKKHQKEIITSYTTIYENIKALNLNNKSNLVNLVGTDISKLEIDTAPRLIIFAIDETKEADSHIQKLKIHFGDKRLILKVNTH